MLSSAFPPVRPVLEPEVVADSQPDATEWWPLVPSGGTFVPLDRQQCREFLGRAGTGWLSRPHAASIPRRFTNYTLTANELLFVPSPPIVLPVGEVVLLQVAHFDARARTAWSVVIVGPSTGYASEHYRHVSACVPVVLPWASADIFGTTLATPGESLP